MVKRKVFGPSKVVISFLNPTIVKLNFKDPPSPPLSIFKISAFPHFKAFTSYYPKEIFAPPKPKFWPPPPPFF